MGRKGAEPKHVKASRVLRELFKSGCCRNHAGMSTGAWSVARKLRGAMASDLPVQQATKLLLTINLKTAKSLGLTVPTLLIARADEVIERARQLSGHRVKEIGR